MNTTQTSTTDDLTHDDMDMLTHVLENVRGSSPDSLYRQVDFVEDEFEAGV